MGRTALACVLIVMGTGLWAHEMDYGTFNPKAPPETAQFDFLKGKWEVTVLWKQGPDQVSEYKAIFTCSWVVNGFVFQQDWEGPYTTGRELRLYNPKLGKWVGYNVYAGRGFIPMEGVFENGRMVLLLRVNDRRGKFLNRETYFNITQNSFEMKSELSFDEGKTWQEGRYRLKGSRME